MNLSNGVFISTKSMNLLYRHKVTFTWTPNMHFYFIQNLGGGNSQRFYQLKAVLPRGVRKPKISTQMLGEGGQSTTFLKIRLFIQDLLRKYREKSFFCGFGCLNVLFRPNFLEKIRHIISRDILKQKIEIFFKIFFIYGVLMTSKLRHFYVIYTI